jgi:hypothetical protein
MAEASYYAGPRYDPALVMAGRYKGPKFSLRTVDPSEDSYAGPRLSVPKEETETAQGATGQTAQAQQRRPVLVLPVVTGGDAATTPPPPTRPTQYEQDAARYRQLLSQPLEETGRVKGALEMAAMPVQPSNSLGYELGERLGHAASGLIDKHAVGRVKRQGELDQAQAQMQADAEAEKTQADINLKKATAAATAAKPEEMRRRLDESEARERDQAAYNRGRLDESRANRESKESEGDKNRKSREDISDKTNETKEKIAADANAQKEKDRASRERIAQWRISAQKEIAAAGRAMQADRLKLSQTNFNARYPGYGKTVTQDDIVNKAKKLKMLPEDVAKDAIRQGYTIQD